MLCELVLLVALFASAADVRPAAVELPFQIVVHPSNDVSSIPRAELSAVFMRRVRSWPDGSEIVPVDQPVRSRVRSDFSRHIHQKSVAYVIRYWHRVIFAGRGVPPREARSDDAVLELVKETRGAIGYISRDTPAGDGVKVVRVTE